MGVNTWKGLLIGLEKQAVLLFVMGAPNIPTSQVEIHIKPHFR
jgi:hypothetical protein